jgi:general secretion pathway protein L
MSIALGIDVGAHFVKVAAIRVAYRKMAVEALGSASIADSGGVAEAIRAAVAEALPGKTADALGTSIEGVKSVVHVLALPASAHKQLDEVLPFELEAALPVDIAESVFDYHVRSRPGFDTGEAPAALSVLAMVARTEDVKARIELVKSALGQEPERVTAGALSLTNLVSTVPALAEDGTSVIIDIGARSSEILVVANGEAVFARAVSWGAEGLSPTSAQRLAREVRMTIGAYRASGGDAPTRAFLCGGGSIYVNHAEAFFAADLSLPVEKLPVPAIDLALIAPERVEQLPYFAKALSLALGVSGRGQGFDLRRGPLAFERGFAWVREKIPILAGLAAVTVVSFLFSAWAQLYSSNKDVAALESGLGAMTKDVFNEETTSAARAQELLAQQGSGADDDPMPHVDAFDVMVKLSEDIPPSTTHDVEELDVQKQHAILHGIVGSIPEAQSINTALAAERCFQDVNISRFNQQPGTERQKYVLDIDLRCPEDPGGKKPKKPAASSTSGGGGE